MTGHLAPASIEVGDVVETFAPIAGKPKYHLCVRAADEEGKVGFILMGKGHPVAANKVTYTIPSAHVPFLRKSKTNLTQFAFDKILPYDASHFIEHPARIRGRISKQLASSLASFWSTYVKSFTKDVKREIFEALISINHPGNGGVAAIPAATRSVSRAVASSRHG